jgi:hypothetical protein
MPLLVVQAVQLLSVLLRLLSHDLAHPVTDRSRCHLPLERLPDLAEQTGTRLPQSLDLFYSWDRFQRHHLWLKPRLWNVRLLGHGGMGSGECSALACQYFKVIVSAPR